MPRDSSCAKISRMLIQATALFSASEQAEAKPLYKDYLYWSEWAPLPDAIDRENFKLALAAGLLTTGLLLMGVVAFFCPQTNRQRVVPEQLGENIEETTQAVPRRLNR